MHDDELTHAMDIPSVMVAEGLASITTINVTSLRQYWEALVSLQSDVICITEVRLSRDQQSIMADRMSAAGYAVIWGAPPPTKLNKREHAYLACGGVAIAVRSHWTAVELPPCSDDARELYRQGRLVSAEVVTPGQSQRLQVHALYVTADPKLRDEQQWQIATALDAAISHGWFQRYAVLAGDFNLELSQAPLYGLLEEGTLACPFHILDTPRPPGQPGEREIDHIMCSPPMLDILAEASVVQYAPFPGHTPVTCHFRNMAPTPQPRLAIPQPLDVQHLPDFPRDEPSYAPAAEVDYLIEFQRHDDAIQSWCAVWEQYLLERSHHGGVAHTAQRGRGSCDRPVWRVPSAQLKPQACYDQHLHSLLTLEKRFNALLHMDAHSPDAAALEGGIRRIWHDLQATPGFPSWPEEGDMSVDRAAWRCHQYLKQLQAARRLAMIQRWRDSYRQTRDPYAVRAHRYVAGKCKLRPFRGLLIDGVFQSSPTDVDSALRTAWQSIHQLKHTDPYTLTQVFDSKYTHLAPAQEEMEWIPLTGDMLVQALKRTKTHTAAGPCGWRATELRKLPSQAWEQMANILSIGELLGNLPRLCQSLWQVAIPKTEAVQVEATGIRPISIYSILYRVYAKARYHTLRAAFERVLHPDQFGGMQGRNITTPIFHMTRELELAEMSAHSEGTEDSPPLAHWITYDLTKAFDSIHPWLACAVLQRAGYPEPFINTYRHHLIHNVRRWKLPQRGLGEAWCSKTGIAQGCPLSAMSAVAVYAIITKHILHKVAQAGGRVRVLSYIDDFSIGAADFASLQVARLAMQEVIDDFGMQINEKKTRIISPTEHVPQIMTAQSYTMPYQQVAEHKVLGVIMGTGQVLPTASEFWRSKVDAVCARIKRVSRLPVSFFVKIKLIESNALALWRYVPLACPLVYSEFLRISRALMVAFGNGSTRAPAMAQEVMFSVYVKLHHVHPCYCHLYTLCVHYRKLLQSHPSRRILDWSTGTPHGIVGSIGRLCTLLKLTLTPNADIINRMGDCVNVNADECRESWSHRLRQVFRQHELAALQTRRPREFDGVTFADLDQVRRCAHKVTDAQASGILRRYLGGGVMTRDRFSRHNHRGIRFCCEECQTYETTHHVLWECPLYDHLRRLRLADLPPRVCVPAVGLPAPGELCDDVLVGLYTQVVQIVLEYEKLKPKALWREQVLPATCALAACRYRLTTKTSPPPGGWLPIRRQRSRTPKEDTNGHQIEQFVNSKGNAAVRCIVCRREMLERALSKMTKVACPGKPQIRDRQFVLPEGFTELYDDNDRDRIRCNGCHTISLMRHRARFIRSHAACHT
eukprot:1840716-Amphidinium_carterae.1